MSRKEPRKRTEKNSKKTAEINESTLENCVRKKKDNLTHKQSYVVPSYVEEKDFIDEIWEKTIKDSHWCFGCTNCRCSCY